MPKGLQVTNFVKVKGKAGTAEQSGYILLGDTILACNEELFHQKTFAVCVRSIHRAEWPLELQLERSATHWNPVFPGQHNPNFLVQPPSSPPLSTQKGENDKEERTKKEECGPKHGYALNDGRRGGWRR